MVAGQRVQLAAGAARLSFQPYEWIHRLAGFMASSTKPVFHEGQAPIRAL